ncbi:MULTISPECIES: DUF1289 domain-containing protein [Marinobacter]|jgi:predicted Fe-S protein YdhL (DUF1289 family)|uniref:DUF1289 domain-containing protein n=2 Tax=Marinobacter TaxID=2742 RepID=A0A1M2UXH3_MARNT|nr:MULTISPECIES: DUF1289 domain-containing protein [Marinobacter]MDX5439348.1 DUF1289 domain-containing protein [Alteromonadaceae bacterium]WBU39854.1 DUF1289 domain-containing protein [Marinobacter alkaliphilus]MDX5328933.1 DUF1289 domain-containing protein [Marinobacter sp.]MDX5336026.1 DUF1289 domain-containing protein [Marinobacter sp.]MDX5387070.1 DUF1289 domain-containing protein [Marinobacter sp.]|tara:strand:- start:1430 stop:1612 length:183 start_codon:yes stop_codon:yes gene_type:complete
MKVADKVRSPCVNVCALDENDMCIGCQRTGDEILRWTTMSNDERREVLLKVAEREKQVAL